MNKVSHRSLFFVFFSFLILLSLSVGAAGQSWRELAEGNPEALFVLWASRIPRTAAVMLAGAGLSLCGLIMQTLTQNRFAAPDTVGTVESARLGLLIGLIVWPNASYGGNLLMAFLFAMGGTFSFLTIMKHFRVRNEMTVPLIGLMFGNVIGSIANYLAYRLDYIQSLTAWLQGSFSLIISGQYEWLYIILVLMLLLYFFADYFTITQFGEEAAATLGVSYEKILLFGIILVSLGSAVILITVGHLPYLGVVVPNIVSLLFGDNLRRTHTVTAWFGAGFLLVCDILSRIIIPPYEIPVETILGFIGAGVFLWLVFKGRRKI